MNMNPLAHLLSIFLFAVAAILVAIFSGVFDEKLTLVNDSPITQTATPLPSKLQAKGTPTETRIAELEKKLDHLTDLIEEEQSKKRLVWQMARNLKGPESHEEKEVHVISSFMDSMLFQNCNFRELPQKPKLLWELLEESEKLVYRVDRSSKEDNRLMSAIVRLFIRKCKEAKIPGKQIREYLLIRTFATLKKK